MELRYLRYFVALAEEMNFIRAARRLNLSQPPLSRQIRLLEAELGTELLARSGKRFKLTEAGSYFYETALRILEEVETMERQTRLMGSGAEGFIRIGYIDSVMFSFLPAFLADCTLKLPGIRIDLVELSSEKQTEALLSGRIDLGFIRSWAHIEGIDYDPLGEASLTLVYPESYAARRQSSEQRGQSSQVEPNRAGGQSSEQRGQSRNARLAFFAELPFIGIERSAVPGLADMIHESCLEAGFAPRITYECSRLATVVSLVEAGLGWSIIPVFAGRLPGGGGARIELLDHGMPFGMARKAGPASHAIKTMLKTAQDFIRSQAATTEPLPWS